MSDPRAPSPAKLTPEKGSYCADVSKNIVGMDVRFCQVAANRGISATDAEIAESVGVFVRTLVRHLKAGMALVPTAEITDAKVMESMVTSKVAPKTKAREAPAQPMRWLPSKWFPVGCHGNRGLSGQRSPRMNAWAA